MLTPKQTRRSIRFRGPQGQLLDPDQELDCLCSHSQAIFGTGMQEQPMKCAPWLPDRDDIYTQFRRTKPQKAVAPGTVCGIVIKELAEPPGVLSRNLGNPLHLSLLAKRRVSSPADLRPIALTCGLGSSCPWIYNKHTIDFHVLVLQKG